MQLNTYQVFLVIRLVFAPDYAPQCSIPTTDRFPILWADSLALVNLILGYMGRFR